MWVRGLPAHSMVHACPKPSDQPLVLDEGSPRAAQPAGTCIDSSRVPRSPIQLARPARMIHARSSFSFGACILRGSRTAGGPSRFEKAGCAADGTTDDPELWRATTSESMWDRLPTPTGFAGCSEPSYMSSPSGDADGTGASDTSTWPACDQEQHPVR